MEPDILYAVRPGERNEALKLSLRSLGHLPHRRVFIAGYCPAWVRGVTVIQVRRRVNKFDAIEQNVRQALAYPDLAEDFVYMNDDFYITRPVDSVPMTHGGPVDQYRGKQELRIRMQETVKHLKTFYPEGTLYAYDGVHMPLPLDKEKAIWCLADIPRRCLWRTWYGNSVDAGGEPVLDAKARGGITGDLPTFLSTGAKGFQALHEQINEALPERSPYAW